MSNENLPSPPADLSSAERKRFLTLATELRANGIDPRERADLLANLIHAESTYSELQRERKKLTGNDKLKVIRAANIASAEVRKFRKALLKIEAYDDSEPDYFIRDSDLTDADRAWIKFFDSIGSFKTEAQQNAQESRLRRKHSEPRWEAILYRHDQAVLAQTRVANAAT